MNKILPIILVVLFSSNVYSEDAKFSFTKDEQIKDIELDNLYGNSTEIHNSKFLKQPITKLDYLLMQLKKHAENKASRFEKDETVLTYFNQQERLVGRGKKEPSYNTSSWFIDNNGKILVQLTITDLGSPKIPMSEACAALLLYDIPSFASYPFPIGKSQGYLYQNQLLGEINREADSKKYKKVMKDIANNLMYAVRLESKDKGNVFTMLCLVDSINAEIARKDSGKIRFLKWSLRLR